MSSPSKQPHTYRRHERTAQARDRAIGFTATGTHRSCLAAAAGALGDIMSTLRFDLFILITVIAGAAIAGIYLFMLAVPRNDDEHTHDGISPPGHLKAQFLRMITRLRGKFSR